MALSRISNKKAHPEGWAVPAGEGGRFISFLYFSEAHP